MNFLISLQSQISLHVKQGNERRGMLELFFQILPVLILLSLYKLHLINCLNVHTISRNFYFTEYLRNDLK